MNRLQLVQRLCTESDATASQPSTTLSQTGEALRLVNWIDTAYQEIQAIHVDWDFLRDDFSFSLTDGGTEAERTYTPTQAGASDLNAWYFTKDDLEISIYNSRSDQTFLIYQPWKIFKADHLFGSNLALTGRPYFFSIKPDKSIVFDLIPDDTYTVEGEYYKVPDVMDSSGATADTDEPIFLAQYHMAIVWRALMYFAAWEGASELYAHGEKEYLNMLSQLEADQLPNQSFLFEALA